MKSYIKRALNIFLLTVVILESIVFLFYIPFIRYGLRDIVLTIPSSYKKLIEKNFGNEYLLVPTKIKGYIFFGSKYSYQLYFQFMWREGEPFTVVQDNGCEDEECIRVDLKYTNPFFENATDLLKTAPVCLSGFEGEIIAFPQDMTLNNFNVIYLTKLELYLSGLDLLKLADLNKGHCE